MTPPYSTIFEHYPQRQSFNHRAAIWSALGNDWTVSECFERWRESNRLETMKERFDGSFAQRSLAADEASYSTNRSLCVWDISNGILTIFYLALFICCLLLLLENSKSWSSGQSSGLLWYLGCTSVLCACRFVGFILVLAKGKGEDVLERSIYAVPKRLYYGSLKYETKRFCFWSSSSDSITLLHTICHYLNIERKCNTYWLIS